MTQHPSEATTAQPHVRRLRPSTLLWSLALLLLLLAIAAFVFDFGRNVVAIALPATPTATASVTPALASPTAAPGGDLPATPTPAPSEWVEYVVQPGDTLLSIAAQADIPMVNLAIVNQLVIRPNAIVPGQVLLVPELVFTPEATPPDSGDSPIDTPTPLPTPTATATATSTRTPSPVPTPIPVGRFTMGFPLTMTVGSRQIIFVEIVDAARVAASGDGNLAGTGAAGKIRFAVGQPDVRTETVSPVRLYPEMLAELDAPAFAVDTPGEGAPDAPAWRSLRDGSAVWTWNLTAREAGVQLITVRVAGRENVADPGADVHFEASKVAVLGGSALEALLNSAFVRAAFSPAALLLSILAGAGGFFLRRRERLDRPVKGLPGMQVKQLHAALLSAFPTDESLAQMVRVQLDQNLEVISTGRNLSDITYDLIRWAETNGQVDRLVAGALAENPGNPELQQL